MEVASGTSPLSILAAQYASRIVAIEDDLEMFEIAKQMIASATNIDNIEIRLVDTLEDTMLHEMFDCLICEVLSAGLLLQPQVKLQNQFLQYLKPKGVTIPCGITNLVSLVVANFEPLGIHFRYPFREREDLECPILKTNNVILNDFCFNEQLPIEVTAQARVTAINSGLANALRFETVVHVSEEVSVSGTPTSGQEYELNLQYNHAEEMIDIPNIEISISQ